MFNRNQMKTNAFTPRSGGQKEDHRPVWKTSHNDTLPDTLPPLEPKLLHPVMAGDDVISFMKGSKARTDDDGKPPLAQLPWAAINDLARVQAYGQKKYGDFNNYRKGMEVSRQLSCALRHISEYMEGSNADAESGLNPLAHALCRVAFVLQNIRDGVAIDDRYKPDVAEKYWQSGSD